MKHEKAKPTKEVVESNQALSNPSLEELQRSHHILEALIAVLPPHSKEELVDLLQTLAAGNGSPEAMNSVHQRALQIVSDVCKPNPPQETPSPEHGQATGERRQRDRRQR
ncbi:hypothetical protein SAMN05216420_11377 [Nitrosospira sp. Nl5]|uniref:hypothetical protein n=1 Tax=Nitrosospira sp. Nl5 TaxID=200120 RepID=UPI00088E1226|nr:hypothetical protein [Nitrosospira sp. Nl5]SCY70025.1 hypothetical protein SAMN05216420_11377 [Nitrosospira sp. Nl5]